MFQSMNTYLEHWEPTWLFWLIFGEFAVAIAGLVVAIAALRYGRLSYEWIKKEYEYDEAKDLEKKQRRTRTSKKTTTQPGGISVVEESTETVEPTGEQK
jgi:hypothetical protein